MLILVVALGGLFVATDQVAVTYAQSRVASKIQSALGLAAEPSVSIKHFPFLTQALNRDLDEVTVSANNLKAPTGDPGTDGSDPLSIDRFTAELHHVRINSSFNGAVADSATGTALVSYAAVTKTISHQLSGIASGVDVSYGGNNQVKLAGSIQIPLLGSQQISTLANITLGKGNTLGITLPDGAQQLIGQAAAPQWPISGLPTGIRLSGVQATSDGLQVSLSGKDIHMTG
ncbi:hypothetical protein GCM10010211_16430 [Streptomyces albospinus]|uniref:DUF2993 domain-containing protein n=1 Tax=Streptomyces albospinus TaxID=285515 RepID=A0ABQ2UUS8_9ACTN|nr:DUF2993 domain-containing protein [Streptomyces albospinus]GGU52696.1 hypothetical protein GCM10010211_16430 [Streptomyces albospinus]